MQQFKLQSILNQAQQENNFNILAQNKAVTIRRSTSGEIAKLYSENNIASALLPNPFLLTFMASLNFTLKMVNTKYIMLKMLN